jgi:predicted glycosyltransferase involved in capsule biosynthesis
MNEPIQNYRSDLGIKEIVVESDRPLPLAQARNVAANAATTDSLIFLDVDCIPHPNCFEILMNDLTQYGLSMVNPLYLQSVVDEPTNFEHLAADALDNPARDSVKPGKSDDYGMFWSLGFAISKQDFLEIGGFDEKYVGYGGEDTDFAFMARQADVSLNFSEAIVYHQRHDSYNPPLNWLEDIVVNAHTFQKKWGVWPMEGWLKEFADMGYVDFDGHTLSIVQLPSESDIEACLRQGVF